MSPDVFQQALLATARVACAAALVTAGCGPKQPPPAELGAAAPVDPPAAVAEPVAEPAAEPAAELASPDLEACGPLLAEAKANQDTAAEGVEACCEAVAASYDGSGLEGIQDWDERGFCCGDVQGWQGRTLACTPWGPPAPPAMRALS